MFHVLHTIGAILVYLGWSISCSTAIIPIYATPLAIGVMGFYTFNFASYNQHTFITIFYMIEYSCMDIGIITTERDSLIYIFTGRLPVSILLGSVCLSITNPSNTVQICVEFIWISFCLSPSSRY